MVIVSGKIFVPREQRTRFLELSAEAMTQARKTSGCRDFVVAPDPIERDRVNIYEEWESEEDLAAFRDDGPGEDLSSLIVRAEVFQHAVTSS